MWVIVSAVLWGFGAPQTALTTAAQGSSVLVELHLQTRTEIEHAQALPLDLWSDRIAVGTTLARVRATDRATLDASGLEYTVVSLDLEDQVARERFRLDRRPSAAHGDGTYFEDYRNLQEIETELEALATEHGDLATLSTFGASIEGRPLHVVEITRTTQADAPVLVLNSAQHAREWASVTSAMYVANALVHRADEPMFDSLLTQVVFVIVPVTNPDGYVFSWEDDRFWRKNRRDGVGVDTNRNFAVAFGGQGSSGNPKTNNYRGEAPFSEPETAALRDLLRGYPSLVVHLDVHTFGQLVLYPWGFANEPAPAADTFTMLGAEVAGAMSDPFGSEYIPIPAAQLYPASGNAIDWSYGELGAYAITLELRPGMGERHPEAFDLPAEQISDVGEEVLASVLSLAEFAAGSPSTRPGDDGSASTTGDDDSSTGSDNAASTGEADAGTGGLDSASEDDDGETSSGPTATVGDQSTSSPLGSTSSDVVETGGSEEPSGALDDDGGCNCSSDAGAGGTWTVHALLLLLLGIGRRRQGASQSTRLSIH